MITPEIIEEQISKLSAEESTIRTSHEKLIREHQARTAQVQEIANQNANRMQQIKGAISQLKQLLNGQKPPEETTTKETTTP